MFLNDFYAYYFYIEKLNFFILKMKKKNQEYLSFAIIGFLIWLFLALFLYFKMRNG